MLMINYLNKLSIPGVTVRVLIFVDWDFACVILQGRYVERLIYLFHFWWLVIVHGVMVCTGFWAESRLRKEEHLVIDGDKRNGGMGARGLPLTFLGNALFTARYIILLHLLSAQLTSVGQAGFLYKKMASCSYSCDETIVSSKYLYKALDLTSW